MSNFVKICPVGDGASCYMRTDTQTDRHDEANSRFTQVYERAQNYDKLFTSSTYSRLT